MSVKSRSYEAWERRKCRSKQRYATIEAAIIKVGKNVPLTPYKCPYCCFVHMTSKPQ